MSMTMEKKTTHSLDDLQNEMLAVARGKREAAPPSPAIIMKVLGVPENFRLLSLIIRKSPETISQLAELADRNQANISRTLQRLVSIGFVRLVPEGRTVRPVAIKQGLHMDFLHDTYESFTLAA